MATHEKASQAPQKADIFTKALKAEKWLNALDLLGIDVDRQPEPELQSAAALVEEISCGLAGTSSLVGAPCLDPGIWQVQGPPPPPWRGGLDFLRSPRSNPPPWIPGAKIVPVFQLAN